MPRGMFVQPEPQSMFGRLGDWWQHSTALKPMFDDLVGAATLPGDVYAGRQPVMQPDTGQGVTDPKLADRAMSMAGSMTLGAGAIPAEANALRAGIKLHEYAPRLRPASVSTVPEGHVGIRQAPEHEFGVVQYEKPLTSKQVEAFGLTPLNPRHPYNLEKSFERFRKKFMDEFASAGQSFKGADGSYFVTPSTRPDGGWQLTEMSKDGPVGHMEFDDFDELARVIWGREAYPKKMEELSQPAGDGGGGF